MIGSILVLSVLFTYMIPNTFLLNEKLASLDSAKADMETTNNTIEDLQTKYDTLQTNYDELQTNYTDLQTNYDSLKSNYEDLEENYTDLQTNYDELSSSIIGCNTTGPKLTKSSGVNYHNGHKETYYNLPMNGVVNNAKNHGLEGEYWIRKDGVKMFGLYVMVAADQSRYPYGSIVETSLGDGIVVDTGGFIASNPNQFDIAVNW